MGCEGGEVGAKRGMREEGEDEQGPMERSSEHKRRGGRSLFWREERRGLGNSFSELGLPHTNPHQLPFLCSDRASTATTSIFSSSFLMTYPLAFSLSFLSARLRSSVINHRLPVPLLYPRATSPPLSPQISSNPQPS